MSKPAVGRLLDPLGTYTRDAIHVPIMPIEAGQDLDPGQAVAIRNRMAVSPSRPNGAVGIVDPFLTVRVKAGDRFYLWLKPLSTLRLWHEWTHGLIDGKDGSGDEA